MGLVQTTPHARSALFTLAGWGGGVAPLCRNASRTHRRAIRVWLYAIAALLVLMVMVGGTTRLTDSGLSIVEWRPVTGIAPPLSESAWAAEFTQYKTSSEYELVNKGMSLDEFKRIYWWEWVHRLLGRLIGAAFLIPLVFFQFRGWIEPGIKWRLWFIFGLGALQGAIGWWMVASGLVGRVDVAQERLAVHLLMACLILTAVIFTARRIGEHAAAPLPGRIRAGAFALVVLTFVQLYLGALVAGLRAGKIYNTWPDIDGAFVPSVARLFFEVPWWRNLFDNALTVQFEHRMTAYMLLALAVLHAFDAVRSRAGTAAINGALWLAAAVTLQATLGILTLLNQAPIFLALAHQAVAIVVLMLAIFQAERLAARQPQSGQQKLVLPVSQIG